MTQAQDFSGFVFLDIETTGLEPHDDEILEVGIVLFDLDLNEVDAKSWLIATDDTRSVMQDMRDSKADGYVTMMHEKSGLAGDLLAAPDMGMTKRGYMLEIIQWLEDRGATDLPMCGSSIGGLDRPFLQYHMRELNETFHYGSIDTSSFKRFYETADPDFWENVKEHCIKTEAEVMHRALDDCRYSASVLRPFLSVQIVMDLEEEQ